MMKHCVKGLLSAASAAVILLAGAGIGGSINAQARTFGSSEADDRLPAAENIRTIEFETPVAGAAQSREGAFNYTFPVEDVERAGIYEIALRYTQEVDTYTGYCGMESSALPLAKSLSRGVYRTEDGFCTVIYHAYLAEGDNTLTLYACYDTPVSGLRLGYVSGVDAIADTRSGGDSSANAGIGLYTNRLVAADRQAKTLTAELTIAEEGWYDISYFGGGHNNAEIQFYFTDSVGQKSKVTSLNLTWTTAEWGLSGITVEYEAQLWTNNSYLAQSPYLDLGDDPKSAIDRPYVYLKADTYKVEITSKKVHYNNMSIFGGAVFATKIS